MPIQDQRLGIFVTTHAVHVFKLSKVLLQLRIAVEASSVVESLLQHCRSYHLSAHISAVCHCNLLLEPPSCDANTFSKDIQ